MGKDKTLVEMLKKQKKEGRWLCAIWVTPYDVFQVNGLLEGEKGTLHPGYERVKNETNERVIISNNLITSQGPWYISNLDMFWMKNFSQKKK